jgi:hypothetical protein
MEALSDVLFDSEPLLAGSKTALFYNPLGSAHHGRTKLFRDTNVFQSGQLDYPHRFYVRGIRCAILTIMGNLIPISDRDYWTSTVELIVGQRQWVLRRTIELIDPILLVSPGVWPQLSEGQQKQIRETFTWPICTLPRAEDVRRSEPFGEIQIREQENFQVRVDHETENEGRLFLCALEGVRVRTAS